MTDTIVTITYRDIDSFQLADYGIGQGSLVKYDSDEATLTITMRRSAQVSDDPANDTADILEDFEENWAWPSASLADVDPDGELGVVAYVVTEV